MKIAKISFFPLLCYNKNEVRRVNKNSIINIILTCLYIPLSLFCSLCYMATDGLIDESNVTIIVLTNIFCYIGLFMFVFAILSIVLSHVFYKKNLVKLSYFIRFIPIYLFVIMIILDCTITAMHK